MNYINLKIVVGMFLIGAGFYVPNFIIGSTLTGLGGIVIGSTVNAIESKHQAKLRKSRELLFWCNSEFNSLEDNEKEAFERQVDINLMIALEKELES